MPTVVVLKPFVYSHKPQPNQRLTTETKFVPEQDSHTKRWIPTERTIPQHIWDDPWISEQYADGHIERPEVTAERTRTLQERHEKEAEANAKIAAQAEAAFKRAQGAAKVTQQREDTVADELDTPVNQLRSQQGAGIDTNSAALQEELNTPVDVLQARQAGEEQSNGGKKGKKRE